MYLFVVVHEDCKKQIWTLNRNKQWGRGFDVGG